MGAQARHTLLCFRVKNWGQVLLASLLLCWPVSAVTTKPGIISIDFCADQYLLALAGKDRIQAVSFEAIGPRSFYGNRAEGIPTVNGSVEELIQLQPDLVIRTWRGGPRAVKILNRVGIPTHTPSYFLSIEESFGVLEKTAVAIGEEANAKELLDGYRVRWAKLKEVVPSKLRAAYMTPSGITAGAGTYVNEIIKLAGFDTIAEDAEISGWVPLPLEKLALNPPDLIVTSFFGDPDVHVSHWSSGRHGVYKKLMGDLPVINVPSSYLSCSGAFAVDAAELIRREAQKLGLLGVKAVD